ncbi:uncharacterized protein [Malus domestica]|uniref:uncharacterized protein n=1 Tax=Malus domestica TaxID=3750 RepID=UPI003975133B
MREFDFSVSSLNSKGFHLPFTSQPHNAKVQEKRRFEIIFALSSLDFIFWVNYQPVSVTRFRIIIWYHCCHLPLEFSHPNGTKAQNGISIVGGRSWFLGILRNLDR